MLPAARVNTVIELLGIIAVSKVPMDATIGDYMRGRRYIGSKDRKNIVERSYDIVRSHAKLGYWLNHLKIEDTPRNRVLLWLCLGEERNIREIKTLFDGSKYGAPKLSQEETGFLNKIEGKKLASESMNEAVLVECPAGHEENLRKYFGADFIREMEAMSSGATLDLRVNNWKSDRDQVKQSLEKDRVCTDEMIYAPNGLRVNGKAYLSKTKAFRKGLIEIQDEGSQMIAHLCNVKPGMHVLDYCAGGGGKTLALAAAMQNKGRIVAMDISKARLEKSRSRFKRAGVHDIIELRPLEDTKNRKWLRRQKGTFDVVLVDVPCSGTGTWRRNPDTKWRSFGPQLEELVVTQKEILDKVAKTVKPGGRLVYGTCSLLEEENEAQIDAFLKEHSNFRLVPMNKAWPEGTKAPCEGDYMRLTPYRHNTDGFFAAVLENMLESPEEKKVGT
jgi:16S rRNA (cytosine967-C5)-methyltransferase